MKYFTAQYQHLVACESWIYEECREGQYFEPINVNLGDGIAEKFLDQVLAAATIFRKHMTNEILMKRLTQEQWREYNSATNYSISTNPFKSADKKVRKHNHLRGE